MVNFQLNKTVIIFLLSSVGLISLPHATHLPFPIFGFFSTLFVWRFIAIWKPQLLPNTLVIFVCLMLGIGLMISQYSTIFGRDAGTSLFITALGLKLLEIRQKRDCYLTIYLAFIVAATQFLFLQNILMGGYILMICGALLATLIAINSQNPKTSVVLKTSAIIIAQALPMMIVLFVVFPRIEVKQWSLFESQNNALTGLSDSLEMGTIQNLATSPELVFRAKFIGKIPEQQNRYWRGPVFSTTDGKRWYKPKNNRYQPYLDNVEYTGTAYQYTLLMEPQAKNWVFGLDMPANFERPLSQQANYQLITKANPYNRAEYKISSYSQYNTGYITKTEYANNTQLPHPPSQKITALVKKLQGFNQSTDIYINNLWQHFRNEEFHYTLQPPLMGKNPIDTFLFEARSGFCEHYASAFVYLMRVAQVPARIVTGYQGGTYNQVGDFLEIRQADAHAWAEVWIEGKGWQRLDPTRAIAPERIEREVNIEQQISSGEVNFKPIELDSATLRWLKQSKQLWNSLDYSWQHWVINYNSANQLNFLSRLGLDDLTSKLYWLLGIIVTITLLLASFILRKPRQKFDEIQTIYLQFCRKLEPLKLYRQPSEGVLHFTARIRNKQRQQEPLIQHIADLYLSLRYGKHPTIKNKREFKRLVKQFKISY